MHAVGEQIERRRRPVAAPHIQDNGYRLDDAVQDAEVAGE
jgi:hypothetical protein